MKQLRKTTSDNRAVQPKDDLINPFDHPFKVVDVKKGYDGAVPWSLTTHNNRTANLNHDPKLKSKLTQPSEIVTVKEESSLELTHGIDGKINGSAIVKRIKFFKQDLTPPTANTDGAPKKIEFRMVGTQLSVAEAAALSRDANDKAPSTGNEIIFRDVKPVDKIEFRKNSDQAATLTSINAEPKGTMPEKQAEKEKKEAPAVLGKPPLFRRLFSLR
jgi:hypothetical protein